MNLPDGQLRKSRVVADPRDTLAEALDAGLTGYAIFEPQDTLLLDADGRGVITFRDGVPRLAYYTGTDRGGPAALADLATTGPYHVELYDLPARECDRLGDPDDLAVPPGMPAARLAGDHALAASTRRAAPGTASERHSAASQEGGPDGPEEASDPGAVEAFLDDEAKIAAIRERAREEAATRAAEWGFDEASD